MQTKSYVILREEMFENLGIHLADVLFLEQLGNISSPVQTEYAVPLACENSRKFKPKFFVQWKMATVVTESDPCLVISFMVHSFSHSMATNDWPN